MTMYTLKIDAPTLIGSVLLRDWLAQRSLFEQIPRQCPPEWATPDSD